MKRLVLIGALFGGACGATDDRPHTLEYITQTILAPTCAAAECHSAFKQEVGDQFDTVDATRRSIVANNLVIYPDDMDSPRSSFLIKSLTVGVNSILDSGSTTTVRMPYDAPMPDADIDLIAAWIAEGAPGAQCVPNAKHQGCFVTHTDTTPVMPIYQVVECVDGEVGNVVQTCAQGQVCLVATGNGQCVQ